MTLGEPGAMLAKVALSPAGFVGSGTRWVVAGDDVGLSVISYNKLLAVALAGYGPEMKSAAPSQLRSNSPAVGVIPALYVPPATPAAGSLATIEGSTGWAGGELGTLAYEYDVDVSAGQFLEG